MFLQPPIIPKVSHEGDTSNFDVYPEEDWKKAPPVSHKDLEIFENFWFYTLLTCWELVIVKILIQLWKMAIFFLNLSTRGSLRLCRNELPKYQYCDTIDDTSYMVRDVSYRRILCFLYFYLWLQSALFKVFNQFFPWAFICKKKTVTF